MCPSSIVMTSSSRRPLLLLHGALGSAQGFDPLIELLGVDFSGHGFEAHRFDFPGHGGAPMPDGPFSIATFSKALRAWIVERSLEGIDIFGYSMGGYVALHAARTAPDLIGGVFTLATKFAWDPATSEKEAGMLNPDAIEAKVPKFAAQLRDRHAPGDWREVLARTAEMMRNLGRINELPLDDLREVTNRVRIAVGDHDRMVSVEESVAAYRALPSGSFLVLPDTPHPLEAVSSERLAREIFEFFMS